MRRVFNFSAGPAMLPEEVLLQAQAEMLDWNETGMSVMEIGHRGSEFKKVVDQTEADLRELMNIPNNYKVLFVAGGASTQFAMVPLNLLGHKKIADYMDTGIWSKKAIDEAKHYADVNVVAKTETVDGKVHIQQEKTWTLNPDAAYVHYTPNETIEGVEFQFVPQTGNVPFVADMTSFILAKPIDVSQYSVIYAGTQKNVGQAGLTIVIVREDLIQEALPKTPPLYSYKITAENNSLYNTPPTYAWYIAGLVLAWMKRQGGLVEFEKRNRYKSDKLYNFIDSHPEFYINNVHPSCRSLMNVPFSLIRDDLTALFLNDAKEAGLTNLKGHRLVGGMRASMYNAMPKEGVDVLVDFMKDFARKHG